MNETKSSVLYEIAALKKRHRIRTNRRELNVIQGLIAEETKKGSLHSDLSIAIKIINELLKERKEPNK